MAKMMSDFKVTSDYVSAVLKLYIFADPPHMKYDICAIKHLKSLVLTLFPIPKHVKPVGVV